MRRRMVTLALLGLAGGGACGRVGFDGGARDGGPDADDAPARSYAGTVLAAAPVAYYRLGDAPGGSSAADATGNGFDATFAASGPSASFELGKPGAIANDPDTAALLVAGGASDGSSAFLAIPDDTIAFAGDFTVEGWVLPAAPPSFNMCFFIAEDYLISGFRTGWNTSLQPTFWTSQSGGTLGLDAPAAMTAGAWNHLAFVHRAGEGQIYLNGELVVAGSLDLAPPLSRMVTAFGAESGLPTGDRFDEVALYDRALDAAEIAARYAAAR